MGMRRSIDTNTRRANSAGPAPPPNPAPHGEHHISAKITLSLLWTFGQFPKDLEQIAIWWRPPQRKDQNATSTKKRDTGQGLYRFRNILRLGRFKPLPSTLLYQAKAPRDRIFFGIFTSFPLITKFTSDYYLKERERRKFLNEKESQFCKLLDIVFAFFFPSAFPSSFLTRHGLSLRTHRIVNIVLHIANRLVC